MADKTILNSIPRMTIRVGQGTLSFALPTGDGQQVVFEPYVVKSGMSMPANLREAFKSMDFLRQVPSKARLVIDGGVLMVPISLYDEEEARVMFDHAFPGHEQDVMFSSVLPELNAVAVSAVGKDLKLVVDDHFRDVIIMPAMTPVWNHLYRRSFIGTRQKLYGYFHERRLDVFGFQQNRFRFCKSYDVRHIRDAVFFLLFVWNSLKMNQRDDELHLVGDIFRGGNAGGEHDELLVELHKYLQKVYVINPSAEFNRAPVTEFKNMPFDLQALYVKG